MQKNEPQDRLRVICREQGLAMTHQRHVIFRSIMASDDHPTPEQIYESVRHEIPSISLATVYKCIHTLLELGLIQAASLHHGSIRIDPNLLPHHHLVCRVCSSITDLDDEIVAPPPPRRLPRGFRAETTRIEVVGVCEASAAQTSIAARRM